MDYEKMNKEMQKEMSDMLVDYQSTYTAQNIQNDILQELGDQYQRSRQSINQAKRNLLAMIDSMNILVIKPW